MPKPRYAQVSLEATPWYHCFSRCVRRAFLCGLDGLTQTSYEHRKQWLEDRIYTASTAFVLDLCTYAIMSNHYHVVLHAVGRLSFCFQISHQISHQNHHQKSYPDSNLIKILLIKITNI